MENTFVPVQYEDGTTIITAENLNDIQNELVRQCDALLELVEGLKQKVDKEEGKGLSTFDFTEEYVEEIQSKASENELTQMGSTLTQALATAVSGLEEALDDKANKKDMPQASNTVPNAPGEASPGEATAFARGDHVHPEQTSVTGSSGSCTGTAAAADKVNHPLTLNGAETVSWDGSEEKTVEIPTVRTWTVSIGASEWVSGTDTWAGISAGYKAEVQAEGMTEETEIGCISFAGGDLVSAGQWRYLRPGADVVTLYSEEKPAKDFSLVLTEVK